MVTQLVQEAVKAKLSGHPEVSRQKLEEALVLDPKNPVIAQHVEELANDQKMFIDQTSSEGVDAEGAIELTPANIKKSFHLKGTQQEILRQVLSAYQLTPVMDSSVTQLAIRLDADDVDYAQASQMVKMLTGTFFVPLDPKRVLVAKDTKENRQKYQRLLVESVYIPGVTTAEMTEITNVAKNVFEAPVAVAQPTAGIMTVRAPESRMKALNATLEELLDGKAQVMIEVRLFDINKVRTTELGVVLPSQMTIFNVDSEINTLVQGNQAAINQIIASGLAAPGDYGAILAILIATGQVTSSILTQGFATIGGGLTQFGVVPGSVTLNGSLNTSDTQVLDDIDLRVQDQETATFRVGTRYPIVTSTVSSGGSALSASGINTAGLSSTLAGLGFNASSLSAQATIPQIQYQDLGLTLKATPWVQHGAEVALKMDLEFTALGGTTLNDNPILNNRKYTADDHAEGRRERDGGEQSVETGDEGGHRNTRHQRTAGAPLDDQRLKEPEPVHAAGAGHAAHRPQDAHRCGRAGNRSACARMMAFRFSSYALAHVDLLHARCPSHDRTISRARRRSLAAVDGLAVGDLLIEGCVGQLPTHPGHCWRTT